MVLKPRKIAAGIEKEARRMGSELELQVRLGLTTVQEFSDLQARVLRRVQELEVIGPDLPAAHAILEWIRALNHEVHRKRCEWEAKQRLVERLDALIEEYGLQEQALELHKTLSAFVNVEEAKKWLRGFARECGKDNGHDSLMNLRITVASQRVTTITVGVKDHVDVAYHEDRASTSKGLKAHELYVCGLAATCRRDKIRLFKEAFHEGLVFEKSNPGLAKKKRRHSR